MTAIAPWDPARTDWIDQRTGKLSREAQIWLRDLWARTGGAMPVGYTTVQDEGASVTQRAILNFAGTGVSVADASGKTVVTIPGFDAYIPRLLPAGGSSGEVLAKASGSDYDTEWVPAGAGGGGSLDDIIAVQALL